MKTTPKSSSAKTNLMWVPLQWMKIPLSSTLTHTISPEDHNPPFSSSSSSPSPIHHNHSPSLKDLENLLLHHPPPFSPIHKHSLSFNTRTPNPTRTPARTHHSIFLKDIESILSENNNPPTIQTRKPSIFHRVKTWAHRQAQHPPSPPDASNKVVVYFTSLHIVRRTYEDCRAVRSILKGYNVKMDDRDLSMDRSFVEELKRIIIVKRDKNGGLGLSLSLPRVYVNGKYVGGVEEIRRLHESGELKKMIQGLPRGDGKACKMCGGFRFSVCERCDGSHRVFVDNKVGFKSCSVCNANGLVLCGNCTSVLF